MSPHPYEDPPRHVQHETSDSRLWATRDYSLKARIARAYMTLEGEQKSRGSREWFRKKLSEYGEIDVSAQTLSRWLREGVSAEYAERVGRTIRYLELAAIRKLQRKISLLRCEL